VALLSYVASNYLVSGEPPRRYGSSREYRSYQSFRASDGYFAFAAGNDGQWRKFTRPSSARRGPDPRFV
jgi:formyl-CoA transferase